MRVLVTGASGGLGPAVVEQFLQEKADVFGVARSWTGAAGFTALTGDLTQPADCLRIAAEAGAVDAVVHVMGAFAGGSDADAWDRMLTLNLRSAVNIFNAVLPGMKERGGGALLAIGSRVAVEPAAGLAAYGASKAALVHYIRTLALELRDSGIRANAVLPSTIDTAANRRAMPDADPARWVQPASIAKVVCWLASGEARDVSGAVIPVYGRA